MTFHNGMLRVHGANLEAFCRKYGLEPFEVECGNCPGVIIKVNIPALDKHMAALVCEPCKCGNTPGQYTSRSIDGDVFGAIEARNAERAALQKSRRKARSKRT